MPNPYHDENGRFCSKGEMLSAVNKLAESGNVSAYLELKASYEKLTNSKLATKKSIAPAIKAQKSKEKSENNALKNEYSNMTPQNVLDKLEDVVYNSKLSAEETTQHINAAMEASNYNPQVMNGVFNEFSYEVPYERRVELASKHYPEGFADLVDENTDDLTTTNKSAFKQGIEDVASRYGTDDDTRGKLDRMVQVYAEHAKSEEDLKFAIDNAVYDSVPNHFARAAIASNPSITKKLAIELLDKEIDNGGSIYHQVRQNLTSNLSARGIAVRPSRRGLFNASPLEGRPQGKDLIRQAEVQEQISNHSHPAEKDEHIRNSYAYTDVYETEYRQLKDKLNNKRISVETKNNIRARLMFADVRLNDIEDYSKLRSELQKLKF